MVTADIVEILDLVDADDPVLAGEGLLHRVKNRSLVRETNSTDSISNLTRWEQAVVIVVGHLVPMLCQWFYFQEWQNNVHQAVFHGIRRSFVDTVLTTGSEEVALLDLIRPDTLGDSDHPKEFVDIVARVSKKATKNNQDIVNLMLTHNRVADLFTGAHGFAHGRDMRVVPGVVVDQCRSVSHATNLVAIVPPRHDLGILLGVLAEPLVRLAVIINDMLATVRHSTSEDN